MDREVYGEVYYDGTLGGLFTLLDRLWREKGAWSRRVRRPPSPLVRRGREAQGLLFDDGASGGLDAVTKTGGDGSSPVPPDSTLSLLPDPAALDGAAGILFQVSASAYDALVSAWMSGLPLEAPALRYALGVLAAAQGAVLAAEGGGPARSAAAGPACFAHAGPTAGSGGSVKPDAAPWYTREEARNGAERAAGNRGNDDCGAVLAIAYKVAHEIDRLMGFLRFKPDVRGRYLARCGPDYFVLPALAPHFTRRFGNTPWALIDERRGLALVQEGRGPRLLAAAGGRLWAETGQEPVFDPWEEIWRSYHRLINIESRKNPRLQRQFVPLRYREYLPEFRSD
jgi:hypothetical protein